MNKVIKGVCKDCKKWKTEKCEERIATGKWPGTEGWCAGYREAKK